MTTPLPSAYWPCRGGAGRHPPGVQEAEEEGRGDQQLQHRPVAHPVGQAAREHVAQAEAHRVERHGQHAGRGPLEHCRESQGQPDAPRPAPPRPLPPQRDLHSVLVFIMMLAPLKATKKRKRQ